MLKTAPSFSIFNLENEVKENEEGRAMVSTNSGGGVEFSFGEMGSDCVIEEEEYDDDNEREIDESSEEYYKKMIDIYPSHPLFLKSYAQLLQMFWLNKKRDDPKITLPPKADVIYSLIVTKGDLHGAENYYYRALIANPEDGEVISQYAILLWEHHHDQCKALSYFKRALEVAPDDCNVLAAYANFLWNIEDNMEEDEEEDNTEQNQIIIQEGVGLKQLHKSGSGIDIDGTSVSTDGLEFTTDAFNHENTEEYYKKMVEEFPSNPSFLVNYAQYLYQVKGDLQGAEQLYSRAIQLAHPGDGELMSQYAKFVWEFHHDRDKASYYFELAVQANPGDCNVLAARASFLWETDQDEEEPIAGQKHQFEGEFHGDEEYYSHAILANLGDAEITSQHARSLWEQHHDRDRAAIYFEQALQANPGDCDILAAYASFLWETEDEEERMMMT